MDFDDLRNLLPDIGGSDDDERPSMSCLGWLLLMAILLAVIYFSSR